MSDSFVFTTKLDVVTVTCPRELTAPAAAEFAKQAASLLKEEPRLCVLDMAAVQRIDQYAFRPFVLFHQALKAQGGYLATLRANSAVVSAMHAMGLESVFSPKASMEDAMRFAGLKIERGPPPVIDVNFVNPFIMAARSAIEIQANTQLLPGKPHLKDASYPESFDIAGVISLISDVFNGSIALCFPANVFLRIYSNMVGETHEVITQETEDAAGELLNIIFGQAKTILNEKNFNIQKAIPTVIRGDKLKVHHLARSIAFVVPFETEAGKFYIEVSADAK